MLGFFYVNTWEFGLSFSDTAGAEALCGGNKASELEGKAELCTLGTLQQPPCPAVTPCSLLPLHTPLLLPVPFLALWSRDFLLPDSHCHSSKWNSTRGTCRSCFNTNISFFPFSSPELISQASFGRFVLTRESPGMVLHSGSGAPYHFLFVRHPCPLQKNCPALTALWHFGQNAGGESNFHPYLRHDRAA